MRQACNARTASSTIPNFTMTSTTKMAFSHTLGIKYVICAPPPDHMKTIDDWKWQADQLNALGERVKKAGFQLGYHNHEVEFVKIDGVLTILTVPSYTCARLIAEHQFTGELATRGGAL